MPDVIAFDIDGMLTEPRGVDEFRQAKERRNVVVGVLSGRTKRSITQFVNRTDLNPDFTRSAFWKGIELNKLSDEFGGRNNVYYGSNLKDRVQAKRAGWEYEQL